VSCYPRTRLTGRLESPRTISCILAPPSSLRWTLAGARQRCITQHAPNVKSSQSSGSNSTIEGGVEPVAAVPKCANPSVADGNRCCCGTQSGRPGCRSDDTTDAALLLSASHSVPCRSCCWFPHWRRPPSSPASREYMRTCSVLLYLYSDVLTVDM
jgi:hypothetical protein